MSIYRLYRVGLWSAFKLGFWVGLVLLCLPVLLVTLAVQQGVTLLDAWMSSMIYTLSLPVAGSPTIDISGVQLLHLQSLYDTVHTLAALPQWLAWPAALGALLVMALVTGFGAAIAGLIFNALARLTGGLELTMAAEDGVR